ncbi:hypothetical protein [Mesorhizobium japonicum]|uniref:Msr8220 protein n=1 Tax=Mesorhizobium japonicum (strain LMG 29417 / CECT 9101 / MAFF 303099) TaxID=266835 RepID=Q983Q9_RHILO|nr:hypothetical protein [Mesorhizobium japonicum]BAB53821.1 msr8220 [Mesorhizobium japonicum MAFF 303099]
MSKKILLDCGTSVEPTVKVETTAITAENARQLMEVRAGEPGTEFDAQGPGRGLVRFGWACRRMAVSRRISVR